MTALIADANVRFEGFPLAPITLQVASATTIYQGSLVGQVDQTTGCLPASDTATQWFVGWAQKQVINATSGTSRCQIWNLVQALQLSQNILVSSPGVSAEVKDSSLVDLAAGTSHHVEVGRIMQYVDATHAWIFGGLNKGVISS